MRTTKKDVLKALKKFELAFNFQVKSEEQVELWLEMFKEVDRETFNDAVTSTIKNCKYNPTIATVFEQIEEITGGRKLNFIND
jgi:hypothetical protein